MSYTVQELINHLQSKVAANSAVANMLVVQSRDTEGNGFSPLSCVTGPDKYEPETTWSGYVLHPDDVDEDDCADLTDVFCLWPTN